MHLSVSQRRYNAIAIILTGYNFLTVLLALQVHGQPVNFSDNFSDGNLYEAPVWSGADTLFRIIEMSGNNLLQLNAAGDQNGEAYLSSPSRRTVGSWEFYINMDFAPSGANYALIYLMSDRTDLDGPVNGYVVRAGERGADDRLRLLRLDHGYVADTLITGELPIADGGGYRIKINRTSEGHWTLQEAQGYHSPLSPVQGPVADRTHNVTSYFGVRTIFTRTRSDKFLFDFSITFNALSARQQSNTELDIVFSAALKRPGLEPTDFNLTEAGSPSSITFQSDSVLTLHYDRPLQSGEYELEIGDIEGNTGQQFDGPFVFELNIFDAAGAGDVLINEFLYNPPEDLAEYVELYNPTGRTYDISGWTLNDATGRLRELSKVNPARLLKPDSFIVLAADSSILQLNREAPLHVMGSRFPVLNQDGDTIVLRDSSGLQLDSLYYSSHWGDGTQALERQSTELSAIYPENWATGFGNRIGTPGLPNNKLPPDTVAPTLRQINLIDSTTIRLIFSETLNEQNTEDLDNYTITPSLPIKRVLLHSDTLDLELEKPMIPQLTYWIAIARVEDLFHNPSLDIERSITYYRYTSTQPGDIVINEFLYKGKPEFVELYNRSPKTVNLKNWTLADRNSYTGLFKREKSARTARSIQSSIPMLPDSYIALTGDKDLASTRPNIFFVETFPALNNNRESISIHDPFNNTIDSLHYDRRRWNTGTDQSLERKDPGAGSADPANWSPSPENYSPGRPNPSYEQDRIPPHIKMARMASDSTIEVLFSEFIAPTPELWSFSLEGQELTVAEYNKETADRVKLALAGAFGPAGDVRLAVKGLCDLRGNAASRLSAPLAWPIEAGDVIINELLADPLSDNRDGLPNQAEYVELYNRQRHAVSLEGIYFHDDPDENNLTRDLYPVSTRARWLPGQAYALVHASTAGDPQKGPVVGYFNIPHLSENRNIVIDRTSLSLNKDKDAIYLADSTGAPLDSVYYHGNWHNPNLIDTKGLSLERISPHLSSNDPQNWSTSTHSLGGTPASANSILIKPASARQESGISFSPNPFSPDADGHEDHLAISYRLDAPDYLLRIRIFDRHGRLVRNLSDAKQAGFEGQVLWEGRNEQGQELRIGIYIVLFEAYNSSTGRNRTFKKTVVLARKL